MTMSHTLSSLFTLRLPSFIRLKNGSKADRLLQWKQMIITCLKLYQNFFRFRCKNLKFEFRTNIPGGTYAKTAIASDKRLPNAFYLGKDK